MPIHIFAFDINQFSQFLFSILVTRKFGRSTFERSQIRNVIF